jgi:hypothetical protein
MGSPKKREKTSKCYEYKKSKKRPEVFGNGRETMVAARGEKMKSLLSCPIQFYFPEGGRDFTAR